VLLQIGNVRSADLQPASAASRKSVAIRKMLVHSKS
jgi:hypothetical protein